MQRQLTTTFHPSFSNEIGGMGRPLSDEMMKQHIPSAYAAKEHHARSEKYVHIPTHEVLETLRRAGWTPHNAVQARPKTADRYGYAKHMIRLRHESSYLGKYQPEIAEVVLINSHDGSSAYQLFAGLYRFLCSNGLVAGDTFTNVRVPHKGNVLAEIADAVEMVNTEFPRMLQRVEQMKAFVLHKDEQLDFAVRALLARYGEEESPLKPSQLLEARRSEPNEGSLWTTYNVVQENMIKGGLLGSKHDKNGRIVRRRSRSIKGINQNVALNRSLWSIAERSLDEYI